MVAVNLVFLPRVEPRWLPQLVRQLGHQLVLRQSSLKSCSPPAHYHF